jgi:hypothetical protein
MDRITPEMIPTPLDMLHAPATSTAGENPCQVYKYHQPIVVRTQFHHTKPEYLQKRLYGQTIYGPDLWVCGNCHDSIHEWLGFLLGESRPPHPEPGAYIKRVAEATYQWYVSELGRVVGERLNRE